MREDYAGRYTLINLITRVIERGKSFPAVVREGGPTMEGGSRGSVTGEWEICNGGSNCEPRSAGSPRKLKKAKKRIHREGFLEGKQSY